MKRWILVLTFFCCLFQSPRAQTYHVGDLIFNRNDGSHGVVFWVSPDGTYGWMMAMKDMEVLTSDNKIRNKFSWGNTNDNIPNIPDTRVPWLFPDGRDDNSCNWSLAQYDTSGYEHTRILIDYYRDETLEKLPYSHIDFANGWFIPSSGQAQKMSLMSNFTDSTLIHNGGEPLGPSWHWTSSEYDQGHAYDYFYGDGMLSFGALKIEEWRIRLIRHFFNKPEVSIVDTSYQVLWSTGQELPQIEVTPTENTIYDVNIITSAGCERKVSQQIYVSSPDIQTFEDTVCIGQAYEDKGFMIAGHRNHSPGDHIYDTTLLTNGCQVSLQLKLLVRDTAFSSIDTAFCDGFGFNHNGVIYADSGDFVQRLVGVNTCDSLVRIHLKMLPHSFNTLTATDNVYHTWNEVDYFASGTYQQRFQAANGCDSTVTLNLTIVEVFVDTVFHVDTIYDILGACQGTLPITYHGLSIESFGDHELVPNDSTLIYLKLNEYPVYDDTKTLDSCSRVSLLGRNYTKDTTLNLIYQSAQGCDSTLEVNIRVRQSSVYHAFLDSCDRIVFEDHPYYRDTVLHRIYLNSQDCDSLVSIRLTVLHSDQQTIEINGCDSVNYRDRWYHDSTRVVDSLEGATCSTEITANLYVGRSSYVNLRYDQCDSITVDGGFYVRDTVLYRYHHNQASCDSSTEIQITLRKASQSQNTLDACEFVDYNGYRFLRDTVIDEYFLNTQACDSLHRVYIHVRQASSATERIDSLFRITYQGRAYFEDTVIETVWVNAQGCDSIHRVELYVGRGDMDSSQIVVYWGKVLALSNPSNSEALKSAQYEWSRDGQTLASSRSYVEVGMPIPAGTYRVVARWDQGVLVRERSFGESPSQAIYPNPASKGATLTLEMAKAVRGIEVYHNDGRLLFRIPKLTQIPPSFEAPMTSGVYIMLVIFEDQSTETLKLIVR